MEYPDTFLWLRGISGCGKTIIASTVIEHVMRRCACQQEIGHAYFFFDFQHVKKQNHENMLRSLIMQLSTYGSQVPGGLKILFESCANGLRQPPKSLLMMTLKMLLKELKDVYIVLDALYECANRAELLHDVVEIIGWKAPNAHLLVTSRIETEIEGAFEPFTTNQTVVCIQSQAIKKDIESYVQERLRNDPKLRRWHSDDKVKEEIETTLVAKADGM